MDDLDDEVTRSLAMHQTDAVARALTTDKQRERDRKWLEECASRAERWSKDRSRKVAAIAVGSGNAERSSGYNGFPRGVDDDIEERHARPAKYLWTEHAERNVIDNAARVGAVLDMCTLYCLLYPCVDCARSIINAGIIRLVTPEVDWNDQAPWFQNWRVVQTMFKEARVKHDEVTGMQSPTYKTTVNIIPMGGDQLVESIGTLEWHRQIKEAVETRGRHSKALLEQGVIGGNQTESWQPVCDKCGVVAPLAPEGAECAGGKPGKPKACGGHFRMRVVQA